MKFLALFFLFFSSATKAQELSLVYDDKCFGQCSTEMQESMIPVPGASDISNISFTDGFFHIQHKSGKATHTTSLEKCFVEVSEKITVLTEQDQERVKYELFKLSSLQNTGEKKSLKSLLLNLAKLDKQKNWCDQHKGEAIGEAIEDCRAILSNYEQNKSILAGKIESKKKEHEVCFKNRPVSQVAKKILPMTEKILSAFKRSGEKVSIDGPFCNIGAGTTSALLDELGYVRGKDYLFQSGSSHVYLTLPKENKIVDPTFAQFFKKNSKSYEEIMSNKGFIGSPSELFDYISAHKDDLQYCREDTPDCNRHYYSKALREISHEKDKNVSRKKIETLFRELFYGEKWDSKKNPLIDTAIATSDFFSDKLTNQNMYQSPEVVQMKKELSQFQCLDTSEVSEITTCTKLPPIMKNDSIENILDLANTVQVVQIRSLNHLPN